VAPIHPEITVRRPANVTDADGLTAVGRQHPCMTTAVHQLDDGAWVSVNDTREVNVSDLWRLARHDFCSCQLADFLAEGFVEVAPDGADVEARIAGQCIQCGASGVTDWLTLGRVDPETGAFRPVIPESVHVPGRRYRLATAP
jgi:hypothetical protein